MNETQGPTPTGTSRPYRSLADALRAHRIPEENHAFVEAVSNAVGVITFIDRGRYIEALRREGAALHIGRTYINGFTEDEQVLVGGRALPLQASEGRAPYFYVTQPSALPSATTAGRRSAGTRAAGTRSTAKTASAARAPRAATRREERDYGVCEVCFMVRNAAGKCGCDD
ncbi:hypothetical protein [Microbacterium suwonense]|uniref:Uncharacterized protein n=1 Tax=Microbacterium suwonense TaxID=683047 RepID=A0ABN6X312_9MICO|nr:hypothetical protein [Microbacterium suwonense]BDZ39097.1 hypothetical protein GCM10025863_17110 [Microbacterium suwonense]